MVTIDDSVEAWSQVPNEPVPGTFVQLRVQDSGTGMDDATLRRIWEPFYSTKSSDHGTGLGLMNVRAIVIQHGGWVTVASQQGVGTTFEVYLPVENQRDPSWKPPPNTIPRLDRQLRILAVDDELALRKTIHRILTASGHEVTVAASGEGALRLWQEAEGAFELIITDLIMPGGMGGADLARIIWQEQPDLPFIFASGGATGTVEHPANLRGIGYLDKPYGATELRDAVALIMAPVGEDPVGI